MRINVKFQEQNSRLPVKFTEESGTFNVNFENFQTVTNNFDAPIYEGEYKVTPAVFEKTLNTANKYLKEDVTILKIPYAEVSNTMGGLTVTIGKEV